MVVNHERQGQGGDPNFGGGLGIYDVSTPSRPELLCKWRTHGKGVHRYDFDGRYAYISPTAEGYIGNIMMILDLKDPARPRRSGAGGSRASGRRAARPILGPTALRRAAITRCAWATGST